MTLHSFLNSMALHRSHSTYLPSDTSSMYGHVSSRYFFDISNLGILGVGGKLFRAVETFCKESKACVSVGKQEREYILCSECWV